MVEKPLLRSLGAEPAGPGDADALDLHLLVEDREVLAALLAWPAGPARERFELQALRIGVLALAQAQGRIDADVVRGEGERLVGEIERRLEGHQKEVTGRLERALADYFDPRSGRLSERVERLVRKDGDLEQVLRRLVGQEDSVLARTFAQHVGAGSPLMKALSPEESTGVVRALEGAVEQALTAQRERILREFSLDNREGALARLVDELVARHGKHTGDLTGTVERVVGEFSLDKEDSALSRLVRSVHQAQEQISRELTLDHEGSGLARLKKELVGVLAEHRAEADRFREEVKGALREMQVRREETLRSTRHGGDFEAAAFERVQEAAQRAGHVATATGATTGMIKSCKVGDAVVELGPESAAPGARVVFEMKEVQGYGLGDALKEIEVARKNRQASVGVFVLSARTAPAGLAPLARYGPDVVVTWDVEDPRTDLYLDAALSVATALALRAREDRAEAVDLHALERAVRSVEKLAQGLEEIRTAAETIRSGGERVLNRVRIMLTELSRQVATLDRGLGDVRDALGGADA